MTGLQVIALIAMAAFMFLLYNYGSYCGYRDAMQDIITANEDFLKVAALLSHGEIVEDDEE